MFTRQETDLKRLLAMLLIFACLLCAGCEGGGRSDTGDEVRHIGLPVGRDYHRLQGLRLQSASRMQNQPA